MRSAGSNYREAAAQGQQRLWNRDEKCRQTCYGQAFAIALQQRLWNRDEKCRS